MATGTKSKANPKSAANSRAAGAKSAKSAAKTALKSKPVANAGAKAKTGAKTAAKTAAKAKAAAKSKTAVKSKVKTGAGAKTGAKTAAKAKAGKGRASKKMAYGRLPHIDDATLNVIVAKLDEMRVESLVVVNEQIDNDRKNLREDSDVGDDMDKASQDREREFNLLMHERHLRRLQQVGDAFERITDGTYGLCEGTDEPINPKRLMIMPLARYSLEYQQEQEKMLGRTPDGQLYDEEPALEADDD